MLKDDSVKYSALEVAKYIINKTIEIGSPVSHLKLQKLLYFVQGVMLMEYGKTAFDEEIEAWMYGPVVYDVYREYAYYGSSLIYRPAREDVDIKDQDLLLAINVVIDTFKDVDAYSIVEETHKKGSPWDRVYVKNERAKIQNESIKAYFQQHYPIINDNGDEI